MSRKFITRQKRRKRTTSFNPSREFISESVEEYLKSGGKITKIIPDEDSFKNFVSMRDNDAINDFLSGS